MQQKLYFKIYNPDFPAHGHSSTVHKIEYDKKTNILTVTFHNGNKYEYLNVPNHVYDDAVSATSIGGFLATNVFKVYQSNKLA